MRATILIPAIAAIAVIAWAATPAAPQRGAPMRHEGSLTYATAQNDGGAKQVGGNYAALQFSDDASSAFYGCYKNRRTDKHAGGAIVRAGDDLCEIQANGWDGSTYNTGGTIDFAVDGAPGKGAVPTSFAVWLGGAAASGTSKNQLGLLIDSRANAYFRNGHVGIGPGTGYNPPATFQPGQAPAYPLTVTTAQPGSAIAAFQAGTSAGGAQINVGKGLNPSMPTYGFWGDAATGIGNPATGVVSVMSAHSELVRISPAAGMAVAGATETSAVRLRPTRFAALPACDPAHAGTLAFITDAPGPITTWHQPVRAGGGSVAAMLSCSGHGWHAIDG